MATEEAGSGGFSLPGDPVPAGEPESPEEKYAPDRSRRWPLSLEGAKRVVSKYFTQTFESNPTDQKVKTVDVYVPYILTLRQCARESTEIDNSLNVIKEYLQKVQSAAIALEKELTSEDSSKLITQFFSLYDADPTLSDALKIDMFNMSLSQEQINMYFYVLSEYKDRLTDDINLVSKVPIFQKFPKDYEKILPVDSMTMVSFDFLSSFFKGDQFQFSKGNNKKIISVGIPPALFRQISEEDNVSTFENAKIRDKIVRIKVYRLNRLTPEVVFAPQQFEFEMNRFPTRMLKNWDAQTLYNKDVFELGSIPTKIVEHSTGDVKVHKNLEDAIDKHLDISELPEERFRQIYKNHALSFLLEEYLRWFTDTDFSEQRYFNYTEFDGLKKTIDDQYSALYESIKEKEDIEGAVGIATFDTPAGQVVKSLIDSKSSKGIVVDLTSTIKTYFRKETLLIDLNDLKKRAKYPKKFDRVFNIIFDPDDFSVDVENSVKSSLDDLKKRGVLVGKEGEYLLRDSTPGDSSFDDFFVTIEPYDYKEGP